MSKHYRGLILLIIFTFIILNLIGLDRSPPVWIDEVTLNDPAKELALHGKLRSSVFTGFSGFGEAYFWQPPAQVLVTAAVYKIFGFGIWQTRIPVMLFGAGVVGLLYLLTTYLFKDRRAGIFAAVVFGFGPKFIQTYRSGRLDAQCLFFAALGILLYIKSENANKSYPWVILSGLAIGVAGMTHPIAITWAIAIALLILIFKSKKIKNLILFALTNIAVTIPWLIYAFKHLQLFKNQFVSHVVGHTAEANMFIRFIKELQRYPEAYRLTPLLPIMYFSALFWFLFTRKYKKQIKLKIGILFFVPFLFNAFVMTKGVGMYYLHPFMILAIISGGLASTFFPNSFDFKNIKSLGIQKILITLFLMLVLANILLGGIGGRLATLYSQWQERSYQQVRTAISNHVSSGDVVWGSPQVWYAVESVDASLRLRGEPNPKLHDFIVIRPDNRQQVPKEFTKVSEIGQPLPPVFGILDLPTKGYNLWVYENRLDK